MIRVHILLVLLISVLGSLSAQELMSLPFNVAGTSPIVALGDFDNDGDVDLLTGSGPVFDIRENVGQGQVQTSATSITVPADVTLFVTLDFDLDGATDVAAGRSPLGGMGFDLLRNNSNGTFGPVIPVGVSGFVRALRTGRANGDNRPDLLVVFESGPDLFVQWFRNSSNGVFSPRPPMPFSEVLDFVLADVDADGDEDVVRYDVLNHQFSVLYTNAGSLAAGLAIPLITPFTITPASLLNRRVVCGDFDGDGDRDLCTLISGTNATQLCVARNDGNGLWTALPRQNLPRSISTNLTCIAGDWDGDGKDDIFLRGTTELGVVRSGSGMTFTYLGANPITPPTLYLPNIFAEDLDNDGSDDMIGGFEVLMSSNDGDRLGLPWNGTPGFDWDADGDLDTLHSGILRLNNGRGQMSSTPLPAGFPSSAFAIVAHVMDVDADGDLDLITRLHGGTGFPLPPSFGGHNILVNDRNLAWIDMGSPVLTLGLEMLNPALIRDVNGDGLDDVLSPDRLWLNNGLFRFVPVFFGVPPVPGVPRDVGDVDSDGDLDVLILEDHPNVDVVSFLRNEGASTFTKIQIHGQAGISDVQWIDLDGDTDLDLCVYAVAPLGNSNPHEVTIFENRGTAQPVLHSIPLQAGGGTMDAADVNGDGSTDLVLGVRTQGAATHVQICAATLTPWVFTSSQVYSFAGFSGLADIDADGDPDLLGSQIGVNRLWRGLTAGRRRQYGQGTPGSLGLVPVLGAQGLFRAGEAISLLLTYAPGGAPGLLVVGAEGVELLNAPVPGLNTFVAQILAIFPFSASGTSFSPGTGSAQIPALVPPSLGGAVLFLQAAYYDPGSASGFSCTNGLELAF